MAGQAEPYQDVVNDTAFLQQHDPADGPHQERSPERDQYKKHQNIGAAGRLSGQQKSHRVSNSEAKRRDNQTDPERSKQDRQIDPLVSRSQLESMLDILFDVDRGKIKIAGDA